MRGVVDDMQPRPRPGAMQIPRTDRGADDIVPTLHDDGRNMGDRVDIAQQLGFVEETAVPEIVVLDLGERECETSIGGFGHPRRVGRSELVALSQVVQASAAAATTSGSAELSNR